MKVEVNDNSIIVTAKKYNFIQREVLRNSLPLFFLLSFFLEIIVIIEKPELIVKFTTYILMFFIISLTISLIIDFLTKKYYIFTINIQGENTNIAYYLRNKIKITNFNICNTKIVIQKRGIYKGTFDIIAFIQNNQNLIEVWPDFLLIGKQWKQEDIYELYDILIDYQNKLKE